MKKRRRELALLTLPITFLLVGVWAARRPANCEEKCEVRLGVQGDWRQSQPLALQALSDQLKRCPQSKTFLVWRSERYIPADAFNHYGVLYNRKTRLLRDLHSDESDVERYENVSETAIHQVAALGGDWKLLPQFGAKHAYPYG